ncbi:chromate transporter [Undibacterium rugosum]|uniref:Chromate transporter n=1 Tax=Undibacterium rugosum TaxID=2762291 RepID=A0A923HZ19_9BURK|nr:chromate transporter [Undibacterium rugosum]MBC3933947.1 chromate transporter [Undibacterium rugosum]MBR7777658.1 chromate transporter [Undibacterium rugosum]
MSDPALTPQTPRPASLADLFFSFTWLALQGFGGVLAVVQREIVERKRWLTTEEFVEDWAVAQIMPGPNVMNLSMMIGSRYFGLRGALAALAGMLTVPLIIVLCLAIVYSHFSQNPQVIGALRGMSAVTAGLIIATGLKLSSALRLHPMGRAKAISMAALCFISVAWIRIPLFYVLLVLGGTCWFWVYHIMRKP